MPVTPKIICKSCEFEVTIQGDITWPEAKIQADQHLEDNHTHRMTVETVYIPETEG